MNRGIYAFDLLTLTLGATPDQFGPKSARYRIRSIPHTELVSHTNTNSTYSLRSQTSQLGGDYLWMVKIESKSEMPILGEAKSDIAILTRPK